MKRHLFFALALCGFIAMAVLAYVFVFTTRERDFEDAPLAYDDGFLFLHDEAIALAIAREESERIRGLSGQESIGDREGLLLAFPEPGIHGIWMREMNFAIDIIWLDDNFRVVDIKENALPESFRSILDADIFKPRTPARFVLEVRAGMVREINISIGDAFRYEFALRQ
jgi:uncharacterized membrane protein (UPF0127 family)